MFVGLFLSLFLCSLLVKQIFKGMRRCQKGIVSVEGGSALRPMVQLGWLLATLPMNFDIDVLPPNSDSHLPTILNTCLCPDGHFRVRNRRSRIRRAVSVCEMAVSDSQTAVSDSGTAASESDAAVL